MKIVEGDMVVMKGELVENLSKMIRNTITSGAATNEMKDDHKRKRTA